MVTFLKDLTQIILRQIPSDFYSLCGFHFVFILVAAEEKAGESSSSKQSFGIKTDDSGARYVTEVQTG